MNPIPSAALALHRAQLHEPANLELSYSLAREVVELADLLERVLAGVGDVERGRMREVVGRGGNSPQHVSGGGW